ncbi:hypothetical protein CEXT_90811 [Caerostris extrusa]|uniref:Uncharacterized protein n=1 Tax=Caerostris extrusa TaxID=172846 RepID=A0AAV4P6H7_CAEEX|nr:hypothetical protein CEXT_90811 [Caerostris extrusa]
MLVGKRKRTCMLMRIEFKKRSVLSPKRALTTKIKDSLPLMPAECDLRIAVSIVHPESASSRSVLLNPKRASPHLRCHKSPSQPTNHSTPRQ